MSSTQTKALNVLVKASKDLQAPRLSTLAMKLKLDAFSKVKANIDDMVEKLKIESADEVKDRDFCIGELNTNDRQAAAKAAKQRTSNFRWLSRTSVPPKPSSRRLSPGWEPFTTRRHCCRRRPRRTMSSLAWLSPLLQHRRRTPR